MHSGAVVHFGVWALIARGRGQQKLRAPQERRLSMYRKLNIPKVSARFPGYSIFASGRQS